MQYDSLPKDIKLKEYLEMAITNLSNEYVRATKDKNFEVANAILMGINALLDIKEICKNRNKF